jgi:hypothetical protein
MLLKTGEIMEKRKPISDRNKLQGSQIIYNVLVAIVQLVKE